MKLTGIVTVLTVITGIPFTEWAWSEAPADGYGVVTADGQSELKADADPATEKMLTGYVDVFIKATAPDPTEDVEDAMRAIGVWFRMESIQFEPESGFLHFEWRWVDTRNIVTQNLYVVKFHAHNGYVGEPQIVPYGGYPDAPTTIIPDYTEDGITYSPNDEWSPSTDVGVTQNTVYEKTYHAVITLVNSLSVDFGLLAKNGDYPFTNEQINTLIEWFNNGGKIVCKKEGSPNKDVTNITTARVYYDGTFSNWYVPEVWVSNGQAFKAASTVFTTDEINYMIEWFNNGGKIRVWLYNGSTGMDASGISNEYIAIGGIQFPWAK